MKKYLLNLLLVGSIFLSFQVSGQMNVDFIAFEENICVGESVLFVNSSTNVGVEPGLTYTWTFEDGVNIMGDPNTAGPLQYRFDNPGTFKVTLSIDSLGDASVVKNMEVDIVVSDLPVINSLTLTPLTSLCPGEIIKAEANGTNVDNYVWSYSGGTLATTNSPNDVDVTISSSSTTSITVTPNNTCGLGIPVTESETINGAADPAGSIIGGIEFCESDLPKTFSIAAVNNAVDGYEWKLGSSVLSETSNSVEITSADAPQTGDVLQVTPKNSTCTDGAPSEVTLTVIESVKNLSTINFTGIDKDYCQFDTITFSVTADNADADGYDWEFDSDLNINFIGSSKGASITVGYDTETKSGSNEDDIEVTASNQCGAISTKIDFHLNDAPDKVGSMTGADVTCNNSDEYYKVYNESSSSYFEWSWGDASSWEDHNGVFRDAYTKTFNVQGIQTLYARNYYEETTGKRCYSKDTIVYTVDVKDGLTALSDGVNTSPLLSQGLCQGDTISFSVTQPNATSITWQDYSSILSIVENNGDNIKAVVSRDPNKVGNQINLHVKTENDACGGYEDFNFRNIVAQRASDAVSISQDINDPCKGDVITFTTPNVSGASSYKWYIGGSAQSETSNTFTYNASLEGNLNVRVEPITGVGSCPNGAEYSKAFSVGNTLTAAPNVSSFASSFCGDTNGVVFTIPAVTNATSYNWSVVNADGIYLPSSSSTNSAAFNISSGNGAYIKVSAINACQTLSDSSYVTIDSKPNASLIAPGDVCKNEDATFTVSLSGGAPYNLVYNDGTSDLSINGITSSSTSFDVAYGGLTPRSISLKRIENATCSRTLTASESQDYLDLPDPSFTLSKSTIASAESPMELNTPITGEYSGIQVAYNSAENRYYFNPNGLSGGYSITHTETNGSCSNSTSRPITVTNDALSLNGMNNVYCDGFQVKDTLIATKGTGTYYLKEGANLDPLPVWATQEDSLLIVDLTHAGVVVNTEYQLIYKLGTTELPFPVMVEKIGTVTFLQTDLWDSLCVSSPLRTINISNAGSSASLFSLKKSGLNYSTGFSYSTISQDATIDPIIAGSGDYTITYVHETVNSCQKTASQDFKVYDLPVATFNLKSTYNELDAAITLEDEATILSNHTYSFDGLRVQKNTSDEYEFTPDPSLRNQEVGIRYTLTSPEKCSNEHVETVLVKANAAILNATSGDDAGSWQYCSNGLIGKTAEVFTVDETDILANHGAISNVDFSIIGEASAFTHTGSLYSLSFTPEGNLAKDYTLRFEYTDTANTLFWREQIINIDTVGEIQYASLAGDNEFCEYESDKTFIGSNPSAGLGSFTATRISGGNNLSLNAIPNAAIISPASSEAGEYNLTYTFETSRGCRDQISEVVKIHAKPDIDIIIPATFNATDDFDYELLAGVNSPSASSGTYTFDGLGVSKTADDWFLDKARAYDLNVNKEDLIDIGVNYVDENSCEDDTLIQTRIDSAQGRIIVSNDKSVMCYQSDVEQTVSVIEIDSIDINNPYRFEIVPGIANYSSTHTVSGSLTYQGTDKIILESTQDFAFDPVAFDQGVYQVIFYYQNSTGTDFEVRGSVTVDKIPELGFSAAINDQDDFCVDYGSVIIDAKESGSVGSYFAIDDVPFLNTEKTIFFKTDTISVPKETVPYELKYHYVSALKCELDTIIDFYVHSLPALDFAINTTYNNSAGAFELQGSVNNILGSLGEFKGQGTGLTDTGYVFRPSELKTGAQPELTYEYTDQYQCFNSISKTTTVLSTEAVFNHTRTTTSGREEIYCLGGEFNSKRDTIYVLSPADQGNSIGRFYYDDVAIPSAVEVFDNGLDSVGLAFFMDSTIIDYVEGVHTLRYEYEDSVGTTFWSDLALEVDTMGAFYLDLNLKEAYCESVSQVYLQGVKPENESGAGNISLDQSILFENANLYRNDASFLNTFGSSSGFMYPENITPGTHKLYYSFETTNGCIKEVSRDVVINPLPTLSFVVPTEYRKTDPTINLIRDIERSPNADLVSSIAQASFSSPNQRLSVVSDSIFDPSRTLGDTSSVIIRYSYVDENGCSNELEEIIKIRSSLGEIVSAKGIDVDQDKIYCYQDKDQSKLTDSLYLQNMSNWDNTKSYRFELSSTESNYTTKVFNDVDYLTFDVEELGSGYHSAVFYYEDNDGKPFTINYFFEIDSIQQVSFVGYNDEQEYCEYDEEIRLFGNPFDGDFSVYNPSFDVSTSLYAFNNGDYFDPTIAANSVPASEDTIPVSLTYEISHDYTNHSCTRDTVVEIKVFKRPKPTFTVIPEEVCENQSLMKIEGSLSGGIINELEGDLLVNINNNEADFKAENLTEEDFYSEIIYTYQDERTTCINTVTDSILVYKKLDLSINELSTLNLCNNSPSTQLRGKLLSDNLNNGFFYGGPVFTDGLANQKEDSKSTSDDGVGYFVPTSITDLDAGGTDTVFTVYFVGEVAKGGISCIDTTNISLTVYALPNVSLDPLVDTICSSNPMLTLEGNDLITDETSVLSIMHKRYDNLASFVIEDVENKSELDWDPEDARQMAYVRYVKTNKFGCNNEAEDSIYVKSSAHPNFYVLSNCSADSINFLYDKDEDRDYDVTLVSHAWDFGDDSTYVGVPLDTTKHFYAETGIHSILLKVETAEGCKDSIRLEKNFGSKPDANFNWISECEDQATQFKNSTVRTTFVYDSVAWNFGDGTPISNEENLVTHDFGTAGTYNVKLYMRTTLDCEDTISRVVDIREVVSDYPKLYDFEVSSSGWVPTSEDTLNSWNYGVDDRFNDETKAFYTESYEKFEESKVTGPCFNLEGVERPMLKMNIKIHTANGDGVQVQYTTNRAADSDESLWKTLGTQDKGIGWYNEASIGGLGGKIGWSKEDTTYREVRYNLDEIPLEEREYVRIRVLLGADGSTNYNGVAFDDLFIGSRERLVLLEQFVNTSNSSYWSTVNKIDGIVDDQTFIKDVVNIKYHTDEAFDQFNTDYPKGPSTRSFNLSIPKSPYTVMDGNKFNEETALFNADTLERRMLRDPLFKLDINAHLNEGTGQLTANVFVKDTLYGGSSYADLRVAIVEQVVTDESGDHKYVNRGFMEGVAGQKVTTEEYIEGVEKTFVTDLNDEAIVDWDKMILVAFVEVDGEIGQAVKASSVAGNIVNGLNSGSETYGFNYQLIPNPASNEVFFSLYGKAYQDYNVTIYNQLGEVVQTMVNVSQIENYKIATDELPNGFYLFNIELEDGTSILEKMIIEH